MTETLPDYLQPAPDPDSDFEALLHRVQRVEDLARTDGWQDMRDWLLSLAAKEERAVISGRLEHDEYVRKTARINALMEASDTPARMRQFAENRRPPTPEQENT